MLYRALKKKSLTAGWGVLMLILATCTPSEPPPDFLPKPVARGSCPQTVLSSERLQRGQAVYHKICHSCHAADGHGAAQIFPPLVGHAPRLAQNAAGTDYLVQLVLWGLRGPVAVNKQRFDNVMPSQAKFLRDDEVADVLSYVMHAWGNCRYFSQVPRFDAAAVARLRQHPLTANDVYILRGAVAF